MAKVSTNLSLDADLKREAQALYADLGMDLSTAVNIFLRQSLGTKLSAEPRTRRKAARTLSALNFPVCVPSIRTCRLDGTFLIFVVGRGGRRGDGDFFALSIEFVTNQ